MKIYDDDCHKKIEKEEKHIKKVNEELFNTALSALIKFNECNELAKKIGTGLILPNGITETIVAYLCNLDRLDCVSGDLIDVKNNKIFELKSCSSLGPNEYFDELIYAKFNNNNKEILIFYTGFSSDSIKNIKVNKTQTVGDQQKQGRRPRFNIEKEIIKKYCIKPFLLFNVDNKEVVKFS